MISNGFPIQACTADYRTPPPTTTAAAEESLGGTTTPGSLRPLGPACPRRPLFHSSEVCQPQNTANNAMRVASIQMIQCDQLNTSPTMPQPIASAIITSAMTA